MPESELSWASFLRASYTATGPTATVGTTNSAAVPQEQGQAVLPVVFESTSISHNSDVTLVVINNVSTRQAIGIVVHIVLIQQMEIADTACHRRHVIITPLWSIRVVVCKSSRIELAVLVDIANK